MKSYYIVPSLLAALGFALLIAGISGSDHMSVFGFPLSVLVVRGLGLIVLILSSIAFLAAYGSTLPPLLRTEQRDRPVRSDPAPEKNEDLAAEHQHLSRGA